MLHNKEILIRRITKEVKAFNKKEINIETLRKNLKKANPHEETNKEHEWFNEWVDATITQYLAGSKHLLSVKEPGSITKAFA